MIVVNAIVRTNADSIAALRDAIAAMEQQSRAEAGCLDYTFSVELNDPEVIRITEKWQSQDALVAHFQQPHMAEFRAAMGQHPVSVEASFYEVKEIDFPGG